MKQVTKTPAIVAQLRASYGAAANIDDLAVFRISALNTLPLRKSSGLYKGATNTVEMLAQMAAAVNAESVPINSQHGQSEAGQVVGRMFAAEVQNAELMGLVAIDGKNHPDVVAKMDNGTIDQVSVGILPNCIQCSACGWDFMGADSTLDNIYAATCGNDHVMGTDGAHAQVNGLDLFYELSLVPMGAAKGARIVDPANQSDQLRLAASAKGTTALAVELSATPKEIPPVDLIAFTAAITEKATENGALTASLGTANIALTAATAELATAKETIATLEAAAVEAAKGEVVTLKTEAAAATALVATAVGALTDEAKKILTACGVTDHSTIPTDIPGIVTLIADKRAQFAAVIPVGGRSTSAIGDPTDPAKTPRPTGAFSAPASR